MDPPLRPSKEGNRGIYFLNFVDFKDRPLLKGTL